jgi:hypothetical protein
MHQGWRCWRQRRRGEKRRVVADIAKLSVGRVQHGRGGRLQARLPGWGGQLHQRHQPPVGPGPLAVRDGRRSRRPAAGRPAAPGPWAPPGARPRRRPRSHHRGPRAVPAGQVADDRLVAGTQPRHGGRGWIITSAVHNGVLAKPDANGRLSFLGSTTEPNCLIRSLSHRHSTKVIGPHDGARPSG